MHLWYKFDKLTHYNIKNTFYPLFFIMCSCVCLDILFCGNEFAQQTILQNALSYQGSQN